MRLAMRDFHRAGRPLRFTRLGLGTSPLGNLYRAISNAEAQALLERAWASGVRYFDTAPLYGYGLAEERLGRFLADKPRSEHVVSTKVGRLLRPVEPGEKRDGLGKFFEVPERKEWFDYGYDGVMRSLDASLGRLGLDRVDMLFVHDLDLFTHRSQEALEARLAEFMQGGYRALVELRDQGVIAAFGAGVNEWQPCQWLAERGDFDLFLLAGRYTLLEQEALESFLPMAEERGIGIVIGGPYNSGVLATGPRPGSFYDYRLAPQAVLDRVAQIHTICERWGVRMFEAAFQFPLRHPAVLSVIPGAQSVTEVMENRIAADAELPEGLWQDLKEAGLLHPLAPV
ncbi:aldo/keto reductase [Cereibacter sediminicola]|uniref:aldo/keto reductase n=1 Tax=Cereibacter sediminicola TaxID=2584941 RepID=UPI0011A8021A|nr:aldo/keto reductase [Cereibacter sediminicola]